MVRVSGWLVLLARRGTAEDGASDHPMVSPFDPLVMV